MDAWPERPGTTSREGGALGPQPEGRRHLLPHRRHVDRPSVRELDPIAAALVDCEVAPNGIGMCLAEPIEADVGATALLVGGRGEDQVAARPEPLARE